MEWQPIETAPKDGSSILIYDPDDGHGAGEEPVIYVCYWKEGMSRRRGITGSWTEADGEMYTTFIPTHWMPLPKPPEGN